MSTKRYFTHLCEKQETTFHSFQFVSAAVAEVSSQMAMWLFICCWLYVRTAEDKIHKIRSSFDKTEKREQHINDRLTTWFCPQTTSRTSTSVTADTTPSRVFSIKTITRRGLVSQLNPSFELVTKYLPSVLWPVHTHTINIASHMFAATTAVIKNFGANLIKIND